MSTLEERLWREGLERRGKDWALRTLDSRHGQAGDAVLDVVYEEPYPTREFVQRWCAEQSNKGFRFSSVTIAMSVMLLLVIVCGILATKSWEHKQMEIAQRRQ